MMAGMASDQEFDHVLLAVLRALDRREALYVLVGGAAMILQGLSRMTLDVDLFIPVDVANLERVKDGLRDVFADPAIDEISAADLSGDFAVVRYGPPEVDLVIDLMTRVGEAFRFEDLEYEDLDVGGVRARVATPRTLFRMKKGTLRPKDLADAEALRQRFEGSEEPWE